MDNTISSLRSICILLTILITAAPARADETAESAVWLLSKCTLVHRTGQHHVMLKALRQMDDPTLKPLFSYLVQRRHPVLRIHGILGLGEIAPDNTIDLALVADLKDARTQEELIHTATGSNLITVEQLKQLYTWPGLDDRVKVADFVTRIRAVEEVVAAWTLTGASDYLLQAMCRDLGAMNRLVQDVVLPHPAVSRVESQIVMERLTPGAPVPLR